MKRIGLVTLVAVLISMVSLNASAYDIAVENEDGITIYYNYISDGKELEVTYSMLGTVNSAFIVSMGYQGIKSMTIPHSVTYQNRTRKVTHIGEYAFSYCKGLSSVIIPTSVTYIDKNAFYTTGLTSVDIPNSVTTINSAAFSNCHALVSVSLPDSLEYIDAYTFAYCENLLSINIPDNVRYIRPAAFRENTKLETITIGKNLAYIYSDVFYKCTGLKKVIVKNLAQWCNINFSKSDNMPSFPTSNPLAYSHHIYSDENTEITDLVIPEGVTNISDKAFYSCASLNTVTIPSSLNSVGASAFFDCTGLEKVIVKDIASWCNVSFPTYDSQPLYYAKHLYGDLSTEIKDLEIPDGVTSVRSRAFINCSGLNSVSFSNSVLTIEDDAFYGCNRLNTISLGSNLDTIGEEAFMNTAITSLQIPNNTQHIKEAAFYGCDNLEKVTLGKNLLSIGDQAFVCQNIQEIVSYIESPFSIKGRNTSNKDKGVFSDNTFFNASIYVPIGALETYKKTNGWKDFVWMEEGNFTNVGNTQDNITKVISRYTLNGEQISSSKHGLNIVKMSDGTIKKVMVK